MKQNHEEGFAHQLLEVLSEFKRFDPLVIISLLAVSLICKEAIFNDRFDFVERLTLLGIFVVAVFVLTYLESWRISVEDELEEAES